MPGSRKCPRLCAAVALSLSVLTTAAAANSTATVEPVVLLDGGTIKACGLRASFTGSDVSRTFELRIERRGNKALLSLQADCPLEIAASKGAGPNASATEIIMPRPTLETASNSTAKILTGEPQRQDDRIALSATAENDAIAQMIQQLMIGGGSFSCKREGAQPQLHTLQGPLPQQTRAAYLNCSGDLFRPEEEEQRRNENPD